MQTAEFDQVACAVRFRKARPDRVRIDYLQARPGLEAQTRQIAGAVAPAYASQLSLTISAVNSSPLWNVTSAGA